MPKISTTKPSKLQTRTTLILDRLAKEYPDADCELDYRNAYELLIATILSAQCTDRRVNSVTPSLFARFPTAKDLAAAKLPEVEEIIRPTGFFRSKAKSITSCAQSLVDLHGGDVPKDFDKAVKLKGVGRKTANVVLGHVYGIAEGIAVDTHVLRLSSRLGLSKNDDPISVEQDLMKIVPRERWIKTTDLLIFHGRRVCDARRPKCGACVVFDLCPWASKQAFALDEVKASKKPAPAKRRTRAA